MNVLLITTHLNAGGITSYLSTLAKGLMKYGHNVHIASSGGNKESALTQMGVKCLTLNIRTKSELSPKVYSSIKPLRQYIENHNIQIVHAHTRVTQVIGTLLRRNMGVPYVSTCHGFFKPKWARKKFPCWGEGVIAISPPVHKHLKDDLGVAEKDIHLIPNGIDAEEFKPFDDGKRNKARNEYGLRDEQVIGLVARYSEVKGQDILIRAMPEILRVLPEVKLLLAGQGKTEGRLKEIVKELNLDHAVIFRPIVGQTADLLPIFDLCVMPSRQEGLGLSIMEAQSSGVPVIATNVGGIPSIIENDRTGILVPPENSEELAEATIKLLKDADKMKKLGTAGREFIHQHFSAEGMVSATIKLYEDLSGVNG